MGWRIICCPPPLPPPPPFAFQSALWTSPGSRLLPSWVGLSSQETWAGVQCTDHGAHAATGNLLVKISLLKAAALVSSRGIIIWWKKHPVSSRYPLTFLLRLLLPPFSTSSWDRSFSSHFLSLSLPSALLSSPPLPFAIVCPRHFLLCSSHSLLHLLLLSWQSYE